MYQVHACLNSIFPKDENETSYEYFRFIFLSYIFDCVVMAGTLCIIARVTI